MKAQAMLVASLSKAKLDGMRAVSQVLTQAIPLERLVYSLDDDKGGDLPIRYIAPDYKKPPHTGLSEINGDEKSYPQYGSNESSINGHKALKI